MKEREYNYELLRIISMIAVMMIHVSGTWVYGFTEYTASGGDVQDLLNPVASCLYNTLSRFAVPCFVMISGAFMLDSDKTADYATFYKQAFYKVGIPTLVFSVLYILLRIVSSIVLGTNTVGNFITIAKDALMGSPYYHMWYMYMLVGVYCLAPVVMHFKNSIRYESFRKVAFVFLVWAILSRWTTGSMKLNWDLGQAFEYLGYFMVGYVLRKDLKKSQVKAVIAILLGIGIEVGTALLQYKLQIVNGVMEYQLNYKLVTPYSPTIALASVFIFAGFTMLHVNGKAWISKLSDMSFFMYLFHAGVWDVLCKLVCLTKGEEYLIYTMNNIYWIPIFILAVFIISFILTAIVKSTKHK